MSTTWTDYRPDPPPVMSERQHWHKLRSEDQIQILAFRAGRLKLADCSKCAVHYLREQGQAV